MKRLLAILFAAALLLVSCGEHDPLEYQDRALDMLIHGKLNGVEFSASLTLGEKTETARVFSLSLHSPSTLSGLCLTGNADGTVTLSLGAVKESFASVGAFETVEKLLSLFSLTEIQSISSVAGADVGLAEHSVLTKLDFAEGSLYLSPDSLPVKAEAFPENGEGFSVIIFFDSINF